MPFEITTSREFAASHQLRLYDQAMEPLHGHNWQVRVAVSADQLDSIGIVMDFHELDRLVGVVLQPMDNHHLNDLPAFAGVNPSAENVAWVIARLLRLPARVKLLSVQVWETAQNSAVYRP